MNHDLFYILLVLTILILIYRYKPWRYFSKQQRAQMAKNNKLRAEVAEQLLRLNTRMHKLHFLSSTRVKKRRLKSYVKGLKRRGRKWKTLEKEEVDLLLIQESIRYTFEKRQQEVEKLSSLASMIIKPGSSKKTSSAMTSLKRRKPEEFLTPDQQLLLLSMMEESKFNESSTTEFSEDGGLSLSATDPYMSLGLTHVDSMDGIGGMGSSGGSFMGGGFGGDGFGGGGFGGGGIGGGGGD